MADHRAKYVSQANQAWLAAEEKRRADFLKSYNERHWFPLKYEYGTLSKEAQYRVSLRFDERPERLAAVEAYDQLLYCLISRNTTTNSATVEEVKSWFRPFVEVDGPYSIITDRGSRDRAYVASTITNTNVVVHASGLSKTLANILADTWMISVEFGKVQWHESDYNSTEY
jgi:hypothetical protein